MRPRRFLTMALWLGAGAALLTAQGLTTTQTKNDWEEINFEFNSAILSDGYPSLLRLAELLHQNPDYRVKLEGYTDSVGSNRYNDKLAAKRADEVKRFLEKYGASPNQISTVAKGKREPSVSNRSKEGRFMNRRVTMTVTDGQGRIVSAGGVGEAIKAMQASEETAKRTAQCCDEVLKRLDKLDEILAAVKSLRAENDKLKQDVAALQAAQSGVQRQIQELPKPPQPGEIARIVETEADKAIQKAKPNRFSLLELNVGPTLADTLPFEGFQRTKAGNITFTGRGRYFAPFGKTEAHALQAEGEYRFYKDRQEGQFDLGLVNRYSAFQMGLFSSFKHVNISDLAAGGTLGQGALTLDYVFSRGTIGAFGTKGFLSDRMIARTPVMTAQGTRTFNIFDETFLNIVDQVGGSTQLGAWKNAYFDANFGALFSKAGENRPGGMIRLVQPINPSWAITVEASLNPTLVGAKNTGQIVFGFQFGNWLRPKEYAQVKSAVPVQIPRLRYELLTRRVRTGNAAPVADAGPDQIGVAAGTIRLDGSASYDPDGDPLTYLWQQIAGPTVSITGATQSVATFTAAEGQSYIFRLTVKDSQGAQSLARTTVTTSAPQQVRILRFTATPSAIRAGQSSTLAWQVENADTVEISGIGRVDPKNGTSTVAPTETTMYRLTARNGNGEVSETVTITVERPQARILSFQATPATINAGQSSTLSWQTDGADTASISGIGDVALNGSVSVSPTQTTTYTLTARNRFGESTATATVQVTPLSVPRIVIFSAAPLQVVAGGKSTLVWQVENATDVSISQIGKVNATGTRDVFPTADTVYTLTASNAAGKVESQVSITVVQPAQIGSFTATPPVSPSPGSPVVLSWTSTNGTSASISGVGAVPVNGSVTVNPSVDTTYVLTVVGNGTQATAQVLVKVTPKPPTPPTPPAGQPPVANAGQDFTTLSRYITLDASKSVDPNGGPLTYSWRVLFNSAAITNPNTPNPSVQLGEGFGDYIFELTVTNQAGLSSTATVTVHFISTRVI